MVSSVVALLVCASSVSLIPSVWADSCQSYTSLFGEYHPLDFCFLKHCCGSCSHRYCCNNDLLKLSKGAQELCPEWPRFEKKMNSIRIVAIIFGAVIPILICVGLLVCFVAPCCLFYKKCRTPRHQGQVVGTVTTVVNTPLQPGTPYGYQPSYPGYQAVPVHPGPGGLHNPVAPLPYMGSSGPMQPPYPCQAYGPPPNELSQPPFNPTYDPRS
ncbi:protein shisa-5-like [Nelusetta ayraudi]|uniref:protein shisa-5-like n=1 Tax=Nelusetta ayraudi TaxID=303726 RepID=UPI003F706B97